MGSVGDFLFYVNSLIFLIILIYSNSNLGTDYSIINILSTFESFVDNIIQELILSIAEFWFFFLFTITYLTPFWELGFFIYHQDNISELKKSFFMIFYFSVLGALIYQILS